MSERIRRRYLALVLIVTVVLGFIIVWPLATSDMPPEELRAHSDQPDHGGTSPSNAHVVAPPSIGSSGQ